MIFEWNYTADQRHILVGVFDIEGVNTTGEPISQIEAYVVPKNTQERLPLYFVGAQTRLLLGTFPIFPGGLRQRVS